VYLTVGQTAVATGTYVPFPPAQLSVTPTTAFASSGSVGGPFTPGSTTYEVTNSAGSNLSWSAATDVSWLTLTPSSGILAGGASTNVVVSFNTNASSLAPGNYTGTIGFTNLSSGAGNTARTVNLTVSVHPPVLLTNAQLFANGLFALTLQGVTGGVYSIVTSTNLLMPLSNWAESLRLTNTAGVTVFTNAPLPNASQRYYRARELSIP
jgi:hypothetical protein